MQQSTAKDRTLRGILATLKGKYSNWIHNIYNIIVWNLHCMLTSINWQEFRNILFNYVFGPFILIFRLYYNMGYFIHIGTLPTRRCLLAMCSWETLLKVILQWFDLHPKTLHSLMKTCTTVALTILIIHQYLWCLKCSRLIHHTSSLINRQIIPRLSSGSLSSILILLYYY